MASTVEPLELPDAPETPDRQNAPVVAQSRRERRRANSQPDPSKGKTVLKRVGVTLAVLTVLLLILGGIAEALARQMVPGMIGAAVKEKLNMPASKRVEVDVPGLMLPQLLTDSLNKISIHVPNVETEGGQRAEAWFTADSVPVFARDSKDMRGAKLELAFPKELLQAEIAKNASLKDAEVKLDGGKFHVKPQLTGLLSRLNGMGLLFTPELKDKTLTLKLTEIAVFGRKLDLDQAKALIGDAGEPLLAEVTKAREICVADKIPAGVSPTSFEIGDQRVLLKANLSDDFLRNPAKRELGKCK